MRILVGLPLFSTLTTMDLILMALAILSSPKRIEKTSHRWQMLLYKNLCVPWFLNSWSICKLARMHFVLHCNYKFVVVLHIFGIFLLFVLGFVTKSCNAAKFATIEAQLYALPWRWIACFAFMQHHHHSFTLGFFSLHCNISRIKRVVTWLHR